MTGSLVSPEQRARVRNLATPIATAFGRLGLSPNHLTLIGFGIAVVAAVAAAGQAWLLAGILLIVGGVFDLFDGALARATGQASRLGAFMDSVFDRAGEGVVYIGIAAGCVAAGFGLGAVLTASAMTGAFLVSYVRAKSESLGYTPGSRMAAVGLAPREVRIVILTAGLAATAVLGPVGPWDVACPSDLLVSCLDPAAYRAGDAGLGAALFLITILAAITAIQRIVHVIRQDSSKEHA